MYADDWETKIPPPATLAVLPLTVEPISVSSVEMPWLT